MKTKILTVCFLLAVCQVLVAQELALDQVLDRYYKAAGLENLQKVKTLIMTGTIIQQDAMPVKITRMRPDRFLMEFDIQDITAYQGFDGQKAWWTTPWAGNPKPQIMPEDRARDLRSRADFDGILYDWKAKGHQEELAGRDTVDGKQAYKFKVTKQDGGVEYHSVDCVTFMLVKRLYYRKMRGQEVALEVFFRDYRPVAGGMFAFTQETHVGGQLYNTLQFDTVEADLPVDEAIFRMP